VTEAGRGDRDQERRFAGLSPTPHSTTLRMSQIRPTPEVMALVAPPSFSWMRIFLSLSVLLVFLLIALFSPKSAKPISMKKARSGVRSVLLVGPLASGKTALFSKVRSLFSHPLNLELIRLGEQLVYGHAPPSHTSMKENEGVVREKSGGSTSLSQNSDEKSEKEDEVNF